MARAVLGAARWGKFVTTAPVLSPDAIRLLTPSGGTRPHRLLDFFTNWEDFCAKPHWGPNSGIATLDRSISLNRGYCLSWGIGVYPKGSEPKSGDHPRWLGYNGYEVRCSPQGLEMFAAVNETYPGWVAAFKSRNEVVASKGLDSMVYVGGLPLSTFSSSTSTATKNSRCDAFLKPVADAKFKYLGLDASGACGIKDGTVANKIPNLWLAERALAKGIIPVVEGFPIVTPELFPWANGRFAALSAWPQAPDGIMGGPGYFNRSCPGCFTKLFGWVQGNIPQADRWAISSRISTAGMTPIVEFGDSPEAVWAR